MRLSQHEIAAIIQTFEQYFAENDHIYLFGSRIDDAKSGGDIDLFVDIHRSNQEGEYFEEKIHFLTALKQLIGEQKIDLIISDKTFDDLPIHHHARQTGVKLK